ncbi:single-stranded-DNA-specific exonuclease RecJ [Thermaerobacter marianensis DSM 12885]|uniref:Single-stranded-DNA-specific exonuclease RecJ n=1 Tax=Thermaerobacter marianensis (strain ATCC 700841 / DSM 12885 / JCM 10246 / 7p75a) TaxID=644966 RepID=E6SLQ8_THEM7|nr:single-stranded-DNA-specific exonuclease RecJ [Thermaerobacter marianensis DSM 12885]
MAGRRWRVRPASPEAAARLVDALGVTPLTARVLAARGWTDVAVARQLLRGRPPLHDPFRLPDMAAAVDRIRRALARGEGILIVGDYDADGVAAAALLYRGLLDLEPDARVQVYIPDRHREGYGVPVGALDAATTMGAGLLITVDNGIAAHGPLAEARRRGLDVIVTDHHQVQDTLPPALAVINPHRPDSGYPWRGLCGAGVVFKLLQALLGDEPASPVWWQLAAVATVADVVPLLDENRALVQRGLEELAAAPLPGLAALAEAAGLGDTRLDAHGVAFILAPRLNAAGRMGSAWQAWELLATDDLGRARALAMAIEQLNRLRRQQEELALGQALQRVERGEGVYGDEVIALAHPTWHQGVLGIVASRLVDLFHRPALVGRRQDHRITGSGRSIAGFHLFRALAACADLFERFGGHAQAAGFTLPADRWADLGARLADEARRHLGPDDRIPAVDVDAVVRPEELTVAAVRELERLAPFGEGNPEPVVALAGLPPAGARTVGGAGEHLRLEWPGGWSAVAFGLGELAEQVRQARQVEVAVRPRVGTFRGEERVDLHIQDLRPAAAARAAWLAAELERRRRWTAELYPDREALVQVYAALERVAAAASPRHTPAAGAATRGTPGGSPSRDHPEAAGAGRLLPASASALVQALAAQLPGWPRHTLWAAVEILREAGVLAPAVQAPGAAPASAPAAGWAPGAAGAGAGAAGAAAGAGGGAAPGRSTGPQGGPAAGSSAWVLAPRGRRAFDLNQSPRYRTGVVRRRLLDGVAAALAARRWEEAERALAHPLAVPLPLGYNEMIRNASRTGGPAGFGGAAGPDGG